MSDVTGPISTLPGSGHDVPDGMECDYHPGVAAVARVQGETDSMGCEMNDMCAECLADYRARLSEPDPGECDWCKKEVADRGDARDYEEGMHGQVYLVCGPCIKRRDKRIAEELARYDDRYGDMDY